MTGMQDDNAPATRKDLRLALEKHQTKEEAYDGLKMVMYRIDDLESRMVTKDDLAASERRIITVMEKWYLDMVGVHKDKISQHEDRITRLETHTGLIAA